MYSLRGLTRVICVLLLDYTTKTYAGFYPDVGGGPSLTNQNQTLYTHNSRSVYAPSYPPHKDVDYAHERDFTQTTYIQEFHIFHINLHMKTGKRQKIGKILTYTFWTISNTNGYYSASVRLNHRYAMTSIVNIGAGPVNYCIQGPGNFVMAVNCSIDDRPSINSFISAIPAFTIGLSVEF